MKLEHVNAFLAMGLGGQLTDNAQGADKLVLPCFWELNVPLVITEILIYPDQTVVTSVAHSFSFFKTGSGTEFGDVTLAASDLIARTVLSTPIVLLGQVDWVSVRHDTNAQDADESGSHVDESTYWAFLNPARYP